MNINNATYIAAKWRFKKKTVLKLTTRSTYVHYEIFWELRKNDFR